ncbi:MAG: sigma-70 family RNA polymerase sigma factor [Clostridiales bacterium]|nr:sigma-70 family RNA polymerase sigma factor [Clostridiales bacterium]MDR2713421.1 sigma-70 family RNA polymerase sigma factor [Clostridiales bacterium]
MNDAQIINGIKNGNEAAIRYAINKYSKLMWRIAATVLKNVAITEDVEECVADVFVYLWQNYDKWSEQRGHLKIWLSSVAKSKAIDRYRQLSKKSELSLNDEMMIKSIPLIDNIMAAETKRELIASVNALAEIDREIVVRRYYYQQKPKEIGFVLDMPVKQVENRLYLSKLKLREMITR